MNRIKLHNTNILCIFSNQNLNMNLFFGLILVLLIGIPNHCLVINKASGEQKEKVEGENELAVFEDHDLDNENVTVVDLIKSLQIFKKRDEKLYEAFAALNDRVKSLELKNSFLLDQVMSYYVIRNLKQLLIC